MADESSEMHSEDDKGFVEKKNKKRMVKTAAQLQALEKFFNEHKYPTEALKMQFAEAVGLTEKQVSGWFCHRRLKDKKLMSSDNNHTGKQERSSGVVQDRGSGHKQDSCGSTKQGDDRNFDNKEVESGRLMSKDYSAVDLAHEHGNRYAGKYDSEDDTNSGSSSPLRDMSNYRDRGPFDNGTSMHLVAKPEHDRRVKARSGPSGYLKLKNRVENPAIIAVKRQLGKHYRDEGPPLSVEFDPLPPGAFEFPVQNPVHERYYSKEVLPLALSDASRVHQNPKFDEVRDYETSIASFNNQVDGSSFKTRHEFSSANSYVHTNFGQKTPSGNNGAYYPNRAFSVNHYESSSRSIHQTRPWPDHLSHGGKAREKHDEPWFSKFSDSGLTSSHREDMKNEYSGSTMVSNRTFGMIACQDLWTMDSPDKFLRINEELLPRQQQQSSPVLDNFPRSYPVAVYEKMSTPNLSDDEESPETSSSVD